jgi:hypothetical protein
MPSASKRFIRAVLQGMQEHRAATRRGEIRFEPTAQLAKLGLDG